MTEWMLALTNVRFANRPFESSAVIPSTSTGSMSRAGRRENRIVRAGLADALGALDAVAPSAEGTSV
jgi:hypothetical protein